MNFRFGIRVIVVFVLALAVLAALGPGVAHAVTTSVNCSTDDLQTAINNATAGDTLNVTGTCVGNFHIDKNLTVQGDGSTVLDGEGDGRTLAVSAFTVNLNDLTVTGGSTETQGGGISNTGGGTLTLQNSTVTGNTVSDDEEIVAGGGIWNSGTLIVRRSTVSGNSASGGAFAIGGGISNNGTLTLESSTVSGNGASGGSAGANGGGVSNAGTMSVQNSTVSGNFAAGAGTLVRGGGIFSFGTLTLESSTVSRNTAFAGIFTQIDPQGGGIWGDASATATLIANNLATVVTTASERSPRAATAWCRKLSLGAIGSMRRALPTSGT